MRSKGRRIAVALGGAALVLIVFAGWLGWPHFRFRYLFEPLGRNAQGFREYRHRRTGIVFVRVPGGTFRMGSSQDDLDQLSKKGIKDRTKWDKWVRDWFIQETPPHRVTVSAFLLAKYEVTQGQWIAVMGSNPSYFSRKQAEQLLKKTRGRLSLPNGFLNDPSNLLGLPVETVTWDECSEFSRRTGLDLPTEAQWEYACRAGSTGPYAGTGKLEEMGWQGEKCSFPGGLKEPNGFGLHDMHGNVAEWCKDIYNDKFYADPAASMPDPCCESGSTERVYRGGGWDMAEFLHRSAYRSHGPTTGSRVAQSFPGYVGFRPILAPLP